MQNPGRFKADAMITNLKSCLMQRGHWQQRPCEQPEKKHGCLNKALILQNNSPFPAFPLLLSSQITLSSSPCQPSEDFKCEIDCMRGQRSSKSKQYLVLSRRTKAPLVHAGGTPHLSKCHHMRNGCCQMPSLLQGERFCKYESSPGNGAHWDLQTFYWPRNVLTVYCQNTPRKKSHKNPAS